MKTRVARVRSRVPGSFAPSLETTRGEVADDAKDVHDEDNANAGRGEKDAPARRSLGSASSQALGRSTPQLRPGLGEVAEDQGAHDENPEDNQRGGENDLAAHRNLGAGARGAMDYVQLQCDGGEPDVDLSYWKDIPQDK